MHQTCKRCKRRQRFEFSIDDAAWDYIPLPHKTKILCIECFLELLDESLSSGTMHIKLQDFHFLGISGDNITGTLHSREK